MSADGGRLPPIGVILFCLAYAALLFVGMMWVLPRFSPREDWLAETGVILTGLTAGLSLSGLWRLKRWALPFTAFFIVLMEAGIFMLGPRENLAAVAVRTALWLMLLAWAYGANAKRFS